MLLASCLHFFGMLFPNDTYVGIVWIAVPIKKYNIIRCTNKFPPFFIKNWAFIVKERNLMFYSKYCPSYCSLYVWHESWSNNSSTSASSYTFGLPLCSLCPMSNSPFLNFWNHSRQLHYMFLQAIDVPYLQIPTNWRSKSIVSANNAYSAQNSTFRTQNNILYW